MTDDMTDGPGDEKEYLRPPRCVLINFTGRQYGFSINDKIMEQWAGLRRQMVDTRLILISPLKILIIDDDKSLSTVMNTDKGSLGFSPITLLKQLLKVRSAIKLLDDGNTIFYLRHPSLSEIPLMLHSRKRNLVLEVNGLLEHEIDRSLRNRLTLFFEKGLAAVALRRAKGMIYVTRELSDLFHPYKTLQVERAVISNGVNVSNFKVRIPSRDANGTLRILAVANFNRWHGYDRLLDALPEYDGKDRIQVFFIGEGPEKDNLVRRAASLSLNNVQFLPPMKGDELDVMFDRCDVALGVLAIQRKGLDEMCPLKHREYCARGIPFIFSGVDPDFPPGISFIYHIPDNKPIDMKGLFEFVKRIREWKDHPQAIRKYAEENLDWSIKMWELEAFLSRL